MPKVSVIIPTYNRSSSVNRLLIALNNQTFPECDFEVIVSIDGSEDDTLEMVSVFSSPYKLSYILEPNSGRASACNKAIQAAKGDVLIILDDDMSPVPRFVEFHHDSHLLDDKLGVVGSAPIEINETSSIVSRFRAEQFNRRYVRMSDQNYKFKIQDFYSGNFSIRKQTMANAGKYDSSFTQYGHEDIELAYRLINSGVKLIFNKEASCTQFNDDGLKVLAEKSFSSGVNVLLFTKLHPDTFDDFELSSYYSSGWKWRTLRLFLIWSTILFPPTRSILIYLVDRIQIFKTNIQYKIFHLLLDYSFWLGVWSTASKDKSSRKLIDKIRGTSAN